MRLKFILFIGLLIFSSCTSTKYGSRVAIDKKSAAARVEYKSHKYLIDKANDKAQTQMWSNEMLENELNDIPLGGYLIINISAGTIDAANTKYWEYIVTDLDENEIVRVSGREDVPEYTVSQYGTSWWNIDVVPINRKINSSFKVYVIDKLMNKRSEFTVHPDE